MGFDVDFSILKDRFRNFVDVDEDGDKVTVVTSHIDLDSRIVDHMPISELSKFCYEIEGENVNVAITVIEQKAHTSKKSKLNFKLEKEVSMIGMSRKFWTELKHDGKSLDDRYSSLGGRFYEEGKEIQTDVQTKVVEFYSPAKKTYRIADKTGGTCGNIVDIVFSFNGARKPTIRKVRVKDDQNHTEIS